MADPVTTLQTVSDTVDVLIDVIPKISLIASAVSAFVPLPQVKLISGIINILALNVKNAKNAK